MHQPDLQPHASSYFQYRIFPFQRPPEMDQPAIDQPQKQRRHPVAIIGAGPIGLVLAIQLAAHGIRTVVIEAQAQVSGGSRALALTRRSMEIIEQSGAAQEFLKEAIVWSEGRSYYRNRVVHHLQIPHSPDDKFAPMTNVAQCIMEQILVDRAQALDIDLRFQTKLTAMDLDQQNVILTLDTPDGEYQLHADYLVACDGARSTVRKLQGLRFEGKSYESRFVIADFRIELDEPPGRRCYFEPPWLPGHSVLVHKAPRNIWRLDYQVPAGVSDQEALDPQRIASHIQAQLNYAGVDLPWTIEWTTLYKPNALTLSKYNHGRVMYCGDAAHLLPVFGVRGMNTGVQDSINLGWKLAAVVHGQAAPAILATYSSERVADARQICIDAGRSTRLMAPPTRGFRIMQQAVLSLSLDHEFTRGLLHWRTSHPIDYTDSPLTLKDATEHLFNAGPHPGAPARNARLDTSNRNTGFLLDAFQPAFQVLVFGHDHALWQAAREDVLTLRERGIRLRLLSIRSDGHRPPDADAVLHDVQGNAQAIWGLGVAEGTKAGTTHGAVYVLRPDQHVCTRWKSGSTTRVAQVIAHLLTAGSTATTTGQPT